MITSKYLTGRSIYGNQEPHSQKRRRSSDIFLGAAHPREGPGLWGRCFAQKERAVSQTDAGLAGLPLPDDRSQRA